VVVNRVNSNKFPDDIISVIRQHKDDTYQFSPVKSGRINRVTPTEACYEAIKLVMEGYDISESALYFESCASEDNWHSRNLEFLFRHGGHRFYK
jgi:spore germination cell wall hydrolase CwlJ-like protein